MKVYNVISEDTKDNYISDAKAFRTKEEATSYMMAKGNKWNEDYNEDVDLQNDTLYIVRGDDYIFIRIEEENI